VSVHKTLVEGQTERSEIAAASWPEGRAARLRIERNDDDSDPRGRVLLDDQVLEADLRLPRGSSGELRVGVSAQALPGRGASVAIDGVRIVKVTE
jgi:hypothetical protein